MITLKQWLELANYRITEGDNYLWNCYGKNPYTLSSWNGVHGADGRSTNITFSTKSQKVFEVCVHDYTHNRAYRMINPNYVEAYKKETRLHGDGNFGANSAWDRVDYVDLDVEEDFMEKATAILSGKDYDTRVMVSLELDHDLELEIYRNAHRLDMTVNDYIQMALVELIKAQAPELLETVDA